MKHNLIAHHRKSDQKSQPLWEHLIEASKHARSFAHKIDLGDLGAALGLLHDLGKASQEYQSYLKTNAGLINPDDDWYMKNAINMRGKIDHSTAGGQVLFEVLNDKSPEDRIAAQILALCAVSHHSGLIDCLTPDGKDNFSERLRKIDEKTHTNEALQKLEPDDLTLINTLLSRNIGKQLVARIKAMRDPNDSSKTYAFKIGLLTRYLFSCLIDADRLSTIDFETPKNLRIRNHGQYQAWQILIGRLEQELKKLEGTHHRTPINTLRQQVSQACLDAATKPKGIFQLTVPTGGGKTLASLRFALQHAHQHQMEHIFYIIPFTSIIDQNAQKIREILEDGDSEKKYLDKVVLEHHSNLTPDEESYRHNLLAENWDAPVVLTTMVQFLETLFGGGTRNVRRMHQLANSVIIFDEIQTLPINCIYLFNIAIRFLVHGCGTTVILCTATQPLLDQLDSQEHSLRISPENKIIAKEKELFEVMKRYTVFDHRRTGGWNDEQIADMIEEELQATGSVLVIVNTKKSARSLYKTVCAKGIATTYHLSTNMCPSHRLDVLDVMKQKLMGQEPVICISTQLIEAGVDIDFGSVIRYLAGLDSITQAAGRCNRNGARPIGNVLIVNPEEENIDPLVDIKKGKEVAERILREYTDNPEGFDNDPLGLVAMKQYYQYYFYQRKDEMGYNVGPDSVLGQQDTLFNVLSTNTAAFGEYFRIHGSQPNLGLYQSFQSAAKSFRVIDAPTRGVIVPYCSEGEQIILNLCSTTDMEEQRRFLKKAQRYSVNLLPHDLKKMIDCGAVHETQEGMGVFYMEKQYYSNLFGWTNQPASDFDLLIV